MAAVEVSLVDAASAKINLTLRVLGRRPDGYHELESLVAFADAGDTLRLQTGSALELVIDGPYAGACGAPEQNLVLKAAAALAARVPGLRLGRFLLTKELPVASGIGGGSADAAAAIRLLVHGNRQIFNRADFSDSRLLAAALATGADVPVCLESKARMMRGIGERLSDPIKLPRWPAILVNSGEPLATRDVFAKLSIPAHRAPCNEPPSDAEALLEWLRQNDNDLTAPAIACVPAIAAVLDALRALPGAKLARMSGSGPTCFALLGSDAEATAAAQSIAARQPHWWCAATRIGGGYS
jgi:4-diphosphocytidyl-2-C-methyl-D-erythritol kinase